MPGRPDRIEIGYVARAHGIRGELRIAVHDPESTSLGRADVVYIGDERFAIERARQAGDAWLVGVRSVRDRDRAEALKGRVVSVDRDVLDLAEDEILLADLVGCAVELVSGESWGTVAAIEPGAQDRLVIRGDGVERLLPVVDELIVELDVDGRRIVIDPPEDWPVVPVESE